LARSPRSDRFANLISLLRKQLRITPGQQSLRGYFASLSRAKGVSNGLIVVQCVPDSMFY
jgi:hypothetical protein